MTRSPAGGGAPSARALEVAVVVDSPRPPAWVVALVARLATSPRFRVAVYRSDARSVIDDGGAAFRLYAWLDARLFGRPSDALVRVGIAALPRPVAELEAADVVLETGAAEADDLAPRTRFGVWRVRHTDGDGRETRPWLFWETYRRAVYGTRLEALLANGERRVLYTSYGATDVASLRRGRSRALWKAHGAVVRRLTALHEGGPAYLATFPLSGQREARSSAPGAATVARHAGKALRGVVARRLRRALYGDRWFIATRARGDASLDRVISAGLAPAFVPIVAPVGRAYADPFAFEHDGRTHLFFEDYDVGSRKGVISHLPLDSDGRPTGSPLQVLERGYHLSYPFVFRAGDGIFMIPESAANGTVDLYRAVAFPSTWAFERTLLRDVRAFDATLLDAFGRLWLFVALAEPGASPNDELHVYSADDLVGPWLPHPQNPVVSDVRSARPAGRIFRDGDRLIRPAQDCSQRYGLAVVLNRIDVLTAREYAETAVGRIDAHWLPGVAATHTYTFTGSVEAIDGVRPFARGGVEAVVELGRAMRMRRAHGGVDVA